MLLILLYILAGINITIGIYAPLRLRRNLQKLEEEGDRDKYLMFKGRQTFIYVFSVGFIGGGLLYLILTLVLTV